MLAGGHGSGGRSVSGDVVALDVGGTHLRSAVVDGDGRCGPVTWRDAPNFLRESGRSAAELQEDLVEVVARVVLEAPARPAAEGAPFVAVSFPGPVDGEGNVLSAPTLWGAQAPPFPLARRLRERLRTPHVWLMNDITAAAWYYADRTPARRFCVVTVSSGIGNKVFDRDHPEGVLLAPNGYGGEIGHATVDDSPEAPLCDCGGRGHLGAISSGRGLERLARRRARLEAGRYPDSSVLAAVGANPEAITNEEHLVPGIRAGDPFAVRMLEEATRPLVRCLATLSLAVGIEQFVFIGGLAVSIGTPYLETLRRLWAEVSSYHMMRDRSENFFVLGERAGEACLIGAGRIALRHRRRLIEESV